MALYRFLLLGEQGTYLAKLAGMSLSLGEHSLGSGKAPLAEAAAEKPLQAEAKGLFPLRSLVTR